MDQEYMPISSTALQHIITA